MDLFTPVDPNEVPNNFQGRRGRWAYPFLKAFLESGHAVVKIERNHPMIGGRSTMNITTGLKNYITKHELPVHIFQRDGEPYLSRTDMNDDGTLPELDAEKALSHTPKPKTLPDDAPVLSSATFDDA